MSLSALGTNVTSGALWVLLGVAVIVLNRGVTELAYWSARFWGIDLPNEIRPVVRAIYVVTGAIMVVNGVQMAVTSPGAVRR